MSPTPLNSIVCTVIFTVVFELCTFFEIYIYVDCISSLRNLNTSSFVAFIKMGFLVYFINNNSVLSAEIKKDKPIMKSRKKILFKTIFIRNAPLHLFVMYYLQSNMCSYDLTKSYIAQYIHPPFFLYCKNLLFVDIFQQPHYILVDH